MMGKQSIDDAEEFTVVHLELLKTKGYSFVICTPVNVDSILEEREITDDLKIMFTPIKNIIEGFILLKSLQKDSFLLTLDEVEDEIFLTKEPYLRFYIKSDSII